MKSHFYLASLIAACTLLGCATEPAVTPVTDTRVSASVQTVEVTENAQRLASLLRQAQSGDVDAQFILAQAYETGQGAAINQDEAFKWYSKAAEAGYVPAQFFLGAMYGSSRGTSISIPKAIYWFRKAADQGYPDAIYPIAYAYENGLGGLPQDNEQALLWYRKAADTGNPFALVRLAKAYRLAELGLSADPTQAGVLESKAKATQDAKRMPNAAK